MREKEKYTEDRGTNEWCNHLDIIGFNNESPRIELYKEINK